MILGCALSLGPHDAAIRYPNFEWFGPFIPCGGSHPSCPLALLPQPSSTMDKKLNLLMCKYKTTPLVALDRHTLS